jgi:hypothetical protein
MRLASALKAAKTTSVGSAVCPISFMSVPSGRNLRPMALLSCMSGAWFLSPTFQTRTCASAPAVATMVESALKITDRTGAS